MFGAAVRVARLSVSHRTQLNGEAANAMVGACHHLDAVDRSGQQEGQSHVVVKRQPRAPDIAVRQADPLAESTKIGQHRRWCPAMRYEGCRSRPAVPCRTANWPVPSASVVERRAWATTASSWILSEVSAVRSRSR